jgi:hypothetical protein
MKFRSCFSDSFYCNVGWQMCIERPAQRFSRVSPIQFKSNYLSLSMNTGIGSTGSKDCPSLPVEVAKGHLKFSLDRACFSLALKALEVCAIVGKSNLVMCHSNPVAYPVGLLLNQFQ